MKDSLLLKISFLIVDRNVLLAGENNIAFDVPLLQVDFWNGASLLLPSNFLSENL